MAAEPAEADHVGLGGAAAGLATGGERVAHEAGGTGADGAVVARLALRILPARVLAGGPAVVVETGAVQRTLAVVYTLAYGTCGFNSWVIHFELFTSGAADQRVPAVAGRAGADRPVRPGPVEPGLALGARPARVRRAQILLLKRPAGDEGVASEAPGTGTDRLVVCRLAGGAQAAHVGVRFEARIAALEADTGLVAGAVRVAGALGVAAGVGVAQEVWRTGALGAVVHSLTNEHVLVRDVSVSHLAVRILPAGPAAAGVLTAVVQAVALLAGPAVPVRVALVAAALQRVPDVGRLAAADRPVVLSNLRKLINTKTRSEATHFTVSVCPARSADLVPGEPAAVAEGIAGCAAGAAADGHVVLHGAVRPGPARDGAGVHTLVVLAGARGPAVRVLVALALDAAGVGVALVAGQALAHRPPALVETLGAAAAHSLHAGVGPAAGPAVGAADVAAEAGAHRPLPAPLAVRVGAAGVALAGIQATAHVGIPDMFGGTLAHRRSPVVFAQRTLAAGVLRARVKVAVGVGVAGVAGLALADCGAAGGGAVSIGAAGRGAARLQPTLHEGVPDVAAAAAADRALPGGRAVRVHPARRLLARVEVTLNERISLVVWSAAADRPRPGGRAVRVDPARRLGARVQHAVDKRISLKKSVKNCKIKSNDNELEQVCYYATVKISIRPRWVWFIGCGQICAQLLSTA